MDAPNKKNNGQKIVEYRTVYSSIPEGFDGIINGLLKDGWQLYGGPCVVLTDQRHPYYSQAMVRMGKSYE